MWTIMTKIRLIMHRLLGQLQPISMSPLEGRTSHLDSSNLWMLRIQPMGLGAGHGAFQERHKVWGTSRLLGEGDRSLGRRQMLAELLELQVLLVRVVEMAGEISQRVLITTWISHHQDSWVAKEWIIQRLMLMISKSVPIITTTIDV